MLEKTHNIPAEEDASIMPLMDDIYKVHSVSLMKSWK
jgi:hypothetical protein